jgi:hypothetical protein
MEDGETSFGVTSLAVPKAAICSPSRAARGTVDQASSYLRKVFAER